MLLSCVILSPPDKVNSSACKSSSKDHISYNSKIPPNRHIQLAGEEQKKANLSHPVVTQRPVTSSRVIYTSPIESQSDHSLSLPATGDSEATSKDGPDSFIHICPDNGSPLTTRDTLHGAMQ